MKYYCKNCGCVIDISQCGDHFNMPLECPVCLGNGGDTMELIPTYETPEQFEKRTGTAYPDRGAVWAYAEMTLKNGVVVKEWDVCIYGHVRGENTYIVIADPPVPPPDGWKPEEITE